MNVFTLRIGNDLYKKLKEAAKAEDRSVNNMLLWIIKKYLDS